MKVSRNSSILVVAFAFILLCSGLYSASFLVGSSALAYPTFESAMREFTLGPLLQLLAGLMLLSLSITVYAYTTKGAAISFVGLLFGLFALFNIYNNAVLKPTPDFSPYLLSILLLVCYALFWAAGVFVSLRELLRLPKPDKHHASSHAPRHEVHVLEKPAPSLLTHPSLINETKPAADQQSVSYLYQPRLEHTDLALPTKRVQHKAVPKKQSRKVEDLLDKLAEGMDSEKED